MRVPFVDLAAQQAEIADEVRVGLDDVFASTIAQRRPGTAPVHFGSDADHAAAGNAEVPVEPGNAPAPAHIAELPPDVGPDSTVRLQTEGLQVAEVLLRAAGLQNPEGRTWSTWMSSDAKLRVLGMGSHDRLDHRFADEALRTLRSG